MAALRSPRSRSPIQASIPQTRYQYLRLLGILAGAALAVITLAGAFTTGAEPAADERQQLPAHDAAAPQGSAPEQVLPPRPLGRAGAEPTPVKSYEGHNSPLCSFLRSGAYIWLPRRS
jgi:hypothetical protein